MRRVLPAIAITFVGLVALASFHTTKPSAAVDARGATSHRLALGAKRAPTTTTPASAPPPRDTTEPTTPTTPITRPTPTTHPAGPSGTFTGDPFDNQYGTVQVQVTVQAGRITAISALQMPFEHSRSAFISQQAEPLLRQEALQAQSAQIDIISGATYTSQSYAQSLQSAIDRAGL